MEDGNEVTVRKVDFEAIRELLGDEGLQELFGYTKEGELVLYIPEATEAEMEPPPEDWQIAEYSSEIGVRVYQDPSVPRGGGASLRMLRCRIIGGRLVCG